MQTISHISIRKRLLAIVLLIAFLSVLLGGRLLYLQVFAGQKLQYMAFDQWTRDLPMRADRGTIVDCNGKTLATSDTSYTLYVRPREMTDPVGATNALKGILGMDYDTLYAKISRTGVSEATVARNLTREQMLEIISKDVSGMYLSADSTRTYPYGNFLTQVMGFTNIDGVGQSGIEQYYDTYLRGTDGAIYTQSDIVGKRLPDRMQLYRPPTQGMQVQLTIDATMQGFAEKAVRDAVTTYQPKSASCLILSANTGEVRAMASAPTFDLNDIPRDDMQALLQGSRNSLVADVYEPGSTFKILTSAIGIETGKIKSSYYCGGSATVDGQRIRCWRSIGHGSQDFAHGIQNSCNCVFMDIALSVGTPTMYEYFDRFGLGAQTGIDISAEASGILLKRDAVKPVDIARIGFGQAIAVTPIQLATAVSSVVNGGYLYQPYVVKQITDTSGKIAFRNDPKVQQRPISQSTSDQMKEYLIGVVSEGSGKNAAVPGYRIGGKTGTAQKYVNGSIAAGKYISSFIGFADVGDETLVCLMIVDEPQGYVYYGSLVAAPYVGEVFGSLFAYRGIEPQYEGDLAESNKTVVMPDLLGMSVAEATAALRSIGLQYEFTGDSGTVQYQLPAPGSTVKYKSVVFFRADGSIGTFSP